MDCPFVSQQTELALSGVRASACILLRGENDLKRLLVLFLVSVICLSVLPSAALANDSPYEPENEVTSKDFSEITKVGDSDKPAETDDVFVPEASSEGTDERSSWEIIAPPIDAETDVVPLIPPIYNDSLEWSLEDGVLTISGTGAMYYNNPYARYPWDDYREEITSVNIGEGITTVGSYAFKNCKNLKSVTIPNSVTEIKSGSFYGCAALTNVTTPASVVYIGDSAFSGCMSLQSITISDAVAYIGSSAFEECLSLSDVYYNGTQEEWDKILTSVMVYNFDGNDSMYLEEVPLSGESAGSEVVISNYKRSFNEALLNATIYFVNDGQKIPYDYDNDGAVSVTDALMYLISGKPADAAAALRLIVGLS